MSGGSFNYSYQQVTDMAHELERSPDVLRRAFAAHLHLVAQAMHDVEWVDSCDYSPGDEHDAIRAVVEQEHIDAAGRALLVSTAYSILRTYGRTSENVECPTCEWQPGWVTNPKGVDYPMVPCPDCTPENVETQT